MYTSRANGGSGYCEDNPATATCIAPLDPATGFTSYIVPTDAAFDLSFILSNDPRPFYAHTSNMTDDRLLYPLLESILGTYRAAFTPATPLVNLTLTQAATVLNEQKQWATTGADAVTGYVQNGQITVTNTAGVSVPITAPAGTTINGATLESYGGEVSGWLAPGSTTGTVPAAAVTITGSPDFLIGQPGTVNVSAAATPTASCVGHRNLPAGVTSTPSSGAVAVAGTPGRWYRRLVSSRRHGDQRCRNDDPSFDASRSPIRHPDHYVRHRRQRHRRPLRHRRRQRHRRRRRRHRPHRRRPNGSEPPVPPAPGTDLVSLTPARLADTRPDGATVDGLFAGTGTRERGSTMELVVAGRGGVAADAAAVALNVTVADPTGGGFVTVYPCGAGATNCLECQLRRRRRWFRTP